MLQKNWLSNKWEIDTGNVELNTECVMIAIAYIVARSVGFH